jgi:hypothetical protein
VAAYARTVKTALGATAVQVVRLRVNSVGAVIPRRWRGRGPGGSAGAVAG